MRPFTGGVVVRMEGRRYQLGDHQVQVLRALEERRRSGMGSNREDLYRGVWGTPLKSERKWKRVQVTRVQMASMARTIRRLREQGLLHCPEVGSQYAAVGLTPVGKAVAAVLLAEAGERDAAAGKSLTG